MDGVTRSKLHWHLTANFRTPPLLPGVYDLVENAIDACEAGASDTVMCVLNGIEKDAWDVVTDFRCEELVDRWAEDALDSAFEQSSLF